jgi:hypothetical protein
MHDCGGLSWPNGRLLSLEEATSIHCAKSLNQWHGRNVSQNDPKLFKLTSRGIDEMALPVSTSASGPFQGTGQNMPMSSMSFRGPTQQISHSSSTTAQVASFLRASFPDAPTSAITSAAAGCIQIFQRNTLQSNPIPFPPSSTATQYGGFLQRISSVTLLTYTAPSIPLRDQGVPHSSGIQPIVAQPTFNLSDETGPVQMANDFGDFGEWPSSEFNGQGGYYHNTYEDDQDQRS